MKINENDLKKLAVDMCYIVDHGDDESLASANIEKIRTRNALYKLNFFVYTGQKDSPQFIYGSSKKDLYEKMIVLYERLIIDYGIHNDGDYITARNYHLSISPKMYLIN